MGPNSFGNSITITTFGESHGKALGVVIDGLNPGLKLDLTLVNQMMNRRRPGGNSLGTQRQEGDKIEILSGLYQGIITGTPLTLLVNNNNQKSGDYQKIEELYRPGHADYTYQQKYGIRDPRGGGRSSGRETLSRTAAGAVAMQYLNKKGITIEAGTVRIGKTAIDPTSTSYNWSKRTENALYCPDEDATTSMIETIEQCRRDGDSVGGIIECHIKNLPIGVGEPAFDKLEALLAHAMMSLGATKGFEIGEGFHAATMFGSSNNDQMRTDGFMSNHAGGILGGISNGEEVIFRVAFKPTPSISQKQRTVDQNGINNDLSIQGRHDPCIVPRAVVVVEAMAAIVTLDLLQIREARRPI